MIHPGSIGSDFQSCVDVYLFFRYTVSDLNNLFKSETMKKSTFKIILRMCNISYSKLFKN